MFVVCFRLFFVIAFISANSSHATSLRWIDQFDQPTFPSDEAATASAISSTGEVVVAGNTSKGEIITTLYSNVGSVIWQNVYAGTLTSTNEATHVVFDGVGDVIVAGTTNDSATKKDLIIFKLDKVTGFQQWPQPIRIDGRLHQDDTPRKVLIDPFDDIYLAADLKDWGPFYFSDIGIIKLSGQTGQVQWRKRIRGSFSGFSQFKVHDEFGDMAMTSGGYLLVVGSLIPDGYSGTGPLRCVPHFLRINSATGAMSPTFVSFPVFYLGLNSISIDPASGEMAVSGTSFNWVDNDFFVASVSPSFSLNWWSSFDPGSGADEKAIGVTIAPNLDVAVVGTTDNGFVMDWLTYYFYFATPPTPGSQVMPFWGRFFTGGASGGPAKPVGIKFAQSGQVLVAGTSLQGANLRMADVRYLPNGNYAQGGPFYSTGVWWGGGDDQLLGWDVDLATGESVLVGSTQMTEPSGTGFNTDWAVLRTGP